MDLSIIPRTKERIVDGETYVIKQAMSGPAVEYRDACARAAKMTDGKITGVDGINAAEPLLVSRCTFKRTDKGLLPISLNMIREEWTDEVVQVFFDDIKELSPRLVPQADTLEKLDKEIAKLQERRQNLVDEETLLKNSQSATIGTSA